MRLATSLFTVLIFCLWFATCAFAVEEETYYQSGSFSLAGDGASYLQVAAGTYDLDENEDGVAGQIEWRFGKKYLFIGPALGLLMNTDGGVYLYGQLYADMGFGNLRIVPAFGFGAHDEGSSEDLGGTFQFISSLSIAYQMTNQGRIGIRYEHISNADIYDDNPGTDPLLLFYEHPF